MNRLFYNLKNLTGNTFLVTLMVLAGFSVATAQISPAPTCDYTLELFDSAGNGWDGAYIGVSVDGAVSVNHTIHNGSSYSLNLPVNNGSIIDLYYNAAAFENEHSYRLFDGSGNIVYQDGPFPTNGPVPTIKATCPLTCDVTDTYVIVIKTGDNPEEISWELENGNGTRVVFANAGTYAGIVPGTEIQIPVNLSTCENYTFNAFDGSGNGWEGGYFQVLSTDPSRGIGVPYPPGSFYEILSAMGTPGAYSTYNFNLPCIECPSDLLELIGNNHDCELAGFVYPSSDLPVAVTCYPNITAGGAPSMTVSYPSATPPMDRVAVGTAVTLPVGRNPVIFESTYGDGQLLRCTTNINVVSSLNPTMSCNDNVNISLNDLDYIDNDLSGSYTDDLGECVLTITPDMVMEAPGLCQGEFIVTIFDQAGNQSIGLVGPGMIGHTLSYRVSHIASTNVCWGEITIEDKLAPHIECIDYTIACNHPYALDEEYTHTDILSPLAGQLPANIAGGAGAIIPSPPTISTLDFEVGCGPLGEVISDIEVYIKIKHTDIADLEISLVDPSGLSTILMASNSCLAGHDDLELTFSDDADVYINSLCDADGTNGFVLPLNPLSIFKNQPLSNYSGNWQIIVTDNNNTLYPDTDPGIGEVLDAKLNIVAGFPAPYIVYDCDDIQVDLINEMVAENNCSEPWVGSEIMRTWRATDPSGNISTCVQTIQLRTPSFNDLEIPGTLNLPCGSDTEPASTGVPKFGCFDVNDDHTGLCDLSYTYSDVEIPACGAGRKIIREWTIVNWCASVTKKYSQVIQVEDREGPSINAQNIQLSASTYSCDADLQLNAFVTDACSEVTQVTASYILGGGPYSSTSGNLFIVDITNTGTINDLPQGVTEVLLLAKDACGNSTQDTIEITVVDDVPPSTICDDNLHVTLNIDGTARVYARDIDEGSFDNCGLEKIEVRRTNGCLGESAWDDFVDFDCCDSDQQITVELRATDYNGNTNMCWLEILIEDKLAPVISCPTDKTINCDQAYNSLSQFGDATASDNCDVNVVLEEIEDIDNCGAGTITRTWTASDSYGNSTDCTQTITFNHVSDYAVQFPIDLVINSCDSEVGDTGEPLLTSDDCELIAVSHEDQVFDIVPDACYKILRTWTVINWCIYDIENNNTISGNALPIPRTFEDDGDGYMQYVQTIKIIDTEDPVIDRGPIDDRVVDVINGCSATFNAPTTTAFDECTGTFDVFPEPASITGTPGQSYDITYTAEDGCGNIVHSTMKVTFLDTKKPTPVCINGLSVDIMQTGMIPLSATDFESGSSYDNCTDYDDLIFSFSPDINDQTMTFTCDDIGTNVVELWATDAAGNQDFCSTYVIIQDNNKVCEAITGSVALAGDIYNEVGDMVEQVTINIDGNNAIPYTTGVNGNYAFPGLPIFGNYTVTPEKDMNPLNGVSTFDLVLMNKHVLGLESLDSPYKLIAADVNNDGNITTFDVVQARQLILFMIQDFPTNTSWRFVDASYDFPVPSNPFSTAFPEVVNYSNMSGDELATNFIAVKVGDVSCDAIPNSLLTNGVDTRNAKTLSMAIDEVEMTQGESYLVDFRAKDFKNMLGYQFTLNFDVDAVSFFGLEAGALNMSEGNLGLGMLDEGVITTSWNNADLVNAEDDEVLFSLEFYAESNANLSEVLNISSRYTNAEAYNSDLEMMEVDLIFNTNTGTAIVADDSFELYQNRPNPFNNTTVIGFNLPEASEATLSIYDVSGKLLKVYNSDYARGYNEVEISKNDFSATGVLYYQLATANQNATMKMIIVE